MNNLILLHVNTDIPAARVRAEGLTERRRMLEARWKFIMEKQAKNYDKKHVPHIFNKGEKVWLNGKNIRTIRPSKKLDFKFFGPCEIIEPIGKQAYRLRLPTTAKGIHDVFHVSLLEPYKVSADREEPQPPPMEVDGEEQWEIEDVLDSRFYYGKIQYLVKWLDYPDTDNQWLPAGEMEGARELTSSFHERYLNKPPSGGPPKKRRRLN